jgi:hypothetical protein
MNRYQKAVATMAAIDILLMLLFPPFLDSPIQRGVPRSFEGFYFLFMSPASRVIHEPLLSIEILVVIANALAAWLALATRNNTRFDVMAAARGLFLFGIVNLAVILLFPPFEPYSSLIRAARQEGFDGFYFFLGDKRHRQVFLPLLYLEVIFITINLLVAWLIFGLIRGTMSTADAHLIEAAHQVPPEKVAALIQVLENVSAAKPKPRWQLGRHDDRRHHRDPDYRGPDRRSGQERRTRPH